MHEMEKMTQASLNRVVHYAWRQGKRSKVDFANLISKKSTLDDIISFKIRF
jgi:hypothetical protein